MNQQTAQLRRHVNLHATGETEKAAPGILGDGLFFPIEPDGSDE